MKKKISHEHCAYESVDEKSLSVLKNDEKKNLVHKGLNERLAINYYPIRER